MVNNSDEIRSKIIKIIDNNKALNLLDTFILDSN